MAEDPPIRVLLVEDSPTAVLLVRMLLDEQGGGAVALSHVGCLADALAAVPSNSYDLILLDLTLPDSYGLDSLHRVYAEASHIPIVVLTAVNDEDLGVRALQSGAQDYLIKDETYKKSLRRSIRYAIERKRAEEALREAKEIAENSTRAKSGFLANLSHELRTPLNAIIGFADVMQSELMGPLGNPKYADYIRDIYSSGHHLLDLINDILDLSKIEAGKLELHEEMHDVPALVDFSLSMVRDRAKQAGIELSAELPVMLPAIRADGVRIRQVLLNLLTNAIKFTPSGGVVRLDARMEDHGLEFRVADTGIGIAETDLPLVMQEFGRVRNERTRAAEGAGLGLPLSVRLIRLHGGEFRLDSKPGAGTTAIFHLPGERLVP